MKLANLFMASADRVILADLGLAKRLGEPSDLTAPGAVMGTEGFWPPEQRLGLNHLVDHRADLFAVGRVLQILLDHAEGPVPLLLRSIVSRCLAEQREDRYQSAAALEAVLRQALQAGA